MIAELPALGLVEVGGVGPAEIVAAGAFSCGQPPAPVDRPLLPAVEALDAAAPREGDDVVVCGCRHV
jgi:hypothetical protein